MMVMAARYRQAHVGGTRFARPTLRIAGFALRIAGFALPAMALLLLGGGAPALGDGFHNAALVTGSIDEWMADLKRAIPDLDQRMSSGSLGSESQMTSSRDVRALQEKANQAQSGGSRTAKPRRGGTIQSALTPEQQALLGRKANDCMQLLAYLSPQNVIPQEFPDFPMGRMGQYRDAAKKLLGAMGSEGTRMAATQLRQELMGAGMPSARDCAVDPTFYTDLLDVLRNGQKNGHLGEQEIKDLLEATQGKKGPAAAALAEQVRKSLSLDDMPVATLIDLATSTTDAKFKAIVSRKLRHRVSEAGILDLMTALTTLDDSGLRGTLADELGRRSPKYNDIKGDLAEIAPLVGSSDRAVASAARQQVANAFQRAPMDHCLWWLGQLDAGVKPVVWEQIDGRIARADETRRAEYAQNALDVLTGKRFDGNEASQAAALDLLAKLKDRKGAKQLSELLLKLPREAWPKAGQTLRAITGQDFGPRAGDDIARVLEAQKSWEKWWREHPE